MSQPKEIKLTKIDSTSKYIPVCLADNELFLKERGRESSNFDVIRPVSAEQLEENRSKSGIREYVKEIWQLAVAGDNTELGLSDYIEDAFCDDIDRMEDEEEYFINKDEEGTDVFDDYENLRELCDNAVFDSTDERVGTWEASGCYRPDPEKVQIIFIIE